MRLFFLAVVVASLGFAESSQAAIFYDLVFRVPGETASLDWTIQTPAASRLDGVEIVLLEEVTDTSVSVLETGNLTAADVAISSANSDGSFENLFTDATGGFDAAAGDGSRLRYASLFGTGLPSAPAGTNRREIVLGTIDLIAPTVGETNFSLADFNPTIDGDFTTTSSGSQGLESIAVNSGGAFRGGSLTVQAVAVAEPSTLAVLSLALGGVVARRRRSRRAPQNQRNPTGLSAHD